MKQLIIYFFISLTVISCNSTGSNPSAAIEKEVKSLTTNEAKREFLLNVLTTDQKYRNEQEEAVLKQGKDSQAYKDFIAERDKMGRENYLKIDQYISVYGHPKPFNVGLNLTATPCTVIHHSGTLEEQMKHYPVLYKAYKKGHFTNFIFLKYLRGMYELKFNKYLKIKSPYTEDDEIAALEAALGISGK